MSRTPGLSGGVTMLRRVNVKGTNLGLTIPSDLSRDLTAAGLVGQFFQAELTEDGILFRPSHQRSRPELPSWAKAEA